MNQNRNCAICGNLKVNTAPREATCGRDECLAAYYPGGSVDELGHEHGQPMSTTMNKCGICDCMLHQHGPRGQCPPITGYATHTNQATGTTSQVSVRRVDSQQWYSTPQLSDER